MLEKIRLLLPERKEKAERSQEHLDREEMFQRLMFADAQSLSDQELREAFEQFAKQLSNGVDFDQPKLRMLQLCCEIIRRKGW
jgi:formyltetrahydrofolate hydrolase